MTTKTEWTDLSKRPVARLNNHVTPRCEAKTTTIGAILKEIQTGATSVQPGTADTSEREGIDRVTLQEHTISTRAFRDTMPDVYTMRKNESPAFCPAGTYHAETGSIETPSGLLLIEFDDSDPGSIIAFAVQELTTLACWTTLSGRGVALLTSLLRPATTAEAWKHAWVRVADTYSHLGDADVSAMSFGHLRALSFDPDIYINWNATPIDWWEDDEAVAALPTPTSLAVELDALAPEYADAIQHMEWKTDGWGRTRLPCPFHSHEHDGWGLRTNACGVYRHKDGNGYTLNCFKCSQKASYRTEPEPVPAPSPAPPPPAIVIVEEPEEDEPLKLPTSVYEGIFETYCDAYKGKTEVAPEYNFACLYTLIGAICGRRYYLNELRPIYPNAFTAIVGQTSLARKSTAISLGRDLLAQSAPDVYNLTALSTPEGLLQLFVPDRYEAPKEEGGDMKLIKGGLSTMHADDGQSPADLMLEHCCDDEGFRILLTLDEIAKMLRKAGSSSSSGLMESLADLFGFPSRIQSPTLSNPVTADNPCLSILGATTYEWFESAFQEEDIHGGIANRFLYFYNPPRLERHFISQRADTAVIASVAKELNGLRRKFGGEDTKAQLPFTWADEAIPIGKNWYFDMCNGIENEENVFVSHALSRTDLYMKKSALIHAILTNDASDTCISVDSLMWAMNLMEYLVRTTREIYTEFNTSQQKRVEERIMTILARKPWQSASAIHKDMKWAKRGDVNRTLEGLVKMQTLAQQQTAQTLKFAIIKEDA